MMRSIPWVGTNPLGRQCPSSRRSYWLPHSVRVDGDHNWPFARFSNARNRAGESLGPAGAESTGAPRRQVAGSAHNNFWRCRDRWGSPRVPSPPEVLARPKGLPSPELDPRSLAGGKGGHRTAHGRRSRRSEATAVQRACHQMDQQQTSTPNSPASTNTATSPSTSPHRPNSANPFTAIQPIRLLHTCGIRGKTGVADGDNGDCGDLLTDDCKLVASPNFPPGVNVLQPPVRS
jgi:hypothetical protein